MTSADQLAALRLAWENRESVRSFLSALASWFVSNPGILMLGSGGTGKSTLGKLLSGKHDLLLDTPGDYKESVKVEEFRLKDDPRTEIVSPPGQLHRRDATWNDLLREVVDGKYRGIIVINAYGYHTLGNIRYQETEIFARTGKRGFLAAYLEERQADELSVLARLTDALHATEKKIWMLSLVTKQDLWWHERRAVEDHYQRQAYSALIKKIQDHHGIGRFRHEFAFASLVIGNFVTGMGETLKTNRQGYDQRMQSESLRRLFEIVSGLKEWETDS
jgi:hypothetical protein